MRNPYLQEGRLPDVIGAITALGTYKFYKLSPDKWSTRISGSPVRTEHWRHVFEEHPEFFRITTDGKVSLVWRRQFPRNYDVDAEPETIPDHDIDMTTESRVSRRPLTPQEVTDLIGAAISLHDRALEQEKAGKWWIALFVAGLSFVGALAGAMIGV